MSKLDNNIEKQKLKEDEKMESSRENLLQIIKENISEPSYETWFVNTKAELNDNTLTIIVPNDFTMMWLEDRYGNLIFETVEEVMGKSLEIKLVSDDKVKIIDNKNPNIKSQSMYDLFKEQNELLTKQQEKIEELEKRIQILEEKSYS